MTLVEQIQEFGIAVSYLFNHYRVVTIERFKYGKNPHISMVTRPTFTWGEPTLKSRVQNLFHRFPPVTPPTVTAPTLLRPDLATALDEIAAPPANPTLEGVADALFDTLHNTSLRNYLVPPPGARFGPQNLLLDYQAGKYCYVILLDSAGLTVNTYSGNYQIPLDADPADTPAGGTASYKATMYAAVRAVDSARKQSPGLRLPFMHPQEFNYGYIQERLNSELDKRLTILKKAGLV